ncbi:MAG TPA: sensor domain-containing diguanylate cyclase [Gammaproteobacteria bacterium]|nr:sensor domain-containing diguanylate cyclase [Gammaproteobacteria bacterium]
MLGSYRSRLVALLTAITGLMVVLLVVSYMSARWVIWEDSSLHLQQTVQLYERNLASQRIELARYAAMIRNDSRIQDYTFAAVRIGVDDAPLRGLIQQHIGRMPVDAVFIYWEDGVTAVGSDAPLLVDDIRRQPAGLDNRTLYIENESGIYLAAILSLSYQGEVLARVAVAQDMGKSWITGQARDHQTQLFIERDGEIIASTMPEIESILFDPDQQMLVNSTDTYRVERVKLPAAGNTRTRFWLAGTTTAQVETLSRYNRVMVGVALATLALMLVTGLIAVNSFSRPIRRLITLTRDMANGQLPTIKRAKGGTEIDQLLNHFIDLIEALRTGQKEVDRAHEKLKLSAITDELTGLYNRRYLNETYPKVLAQADREGLFLSAILFDIDHFKHINDSCGHAAGDACLIEFSAILKRYSRASDYVFRMGGEEFLVLTVGRGGKNVSMLAEKILVATEATGFEYQDETIRLTVSCGISCIRQNQSYHPTVSHLVSLADHALYEAKRDGRNCIRLNAESCGRQKAASLSVAGRRGDFR